MSRYEYTETFKQKVRSVIGTTIDHHLASGHEIVGMYIEHLYKHSCISPTALLNLKSIEEVHSLAKQHVVYEELWKEFTHLIPAKW